MANPWDYASKIEVRWHEVLQEFDLGKHARKLGPSKITHEELSQARRLQYLYFFGVVENTHHLCQMCGTLVPNELWIGNWGWCDPCWESQTIELQKGA